MKRKKKSYSKPKKAFESSRIQEENELVKKYALKNKRELWKTKAKVSYYRKRAKSLAYSTSEEQEVLFNKLQGLGLKVGKIVDILALEVEDLLKRRLPTIIVNKKIANTVKHARQLVVHKKIIINGRVINSPSYLVPVSEENEIMLKKKDKKAKTKTEEKVEEKPEIENMKEEVRVSDEEKKDNKKEEKVDQTMEVKL